MRNQPAGGGGGEEEGQQLASAFFFLARFSNWLKTIQSRFRVFSFAFLLTKFLQFKKNKFSRFLYWVPACN
jgi:hypothetical protein